MADIRFKYGLDSNFKDIDTTKEQKGTIFLSQVVKEINNIQTPYKSYLYFLDSNKNMLNIVPRLLDVENGGTGHTILESDQVLLGNGIEPIKFRPIIDFSTANTDYTLNDTNNLITERTIGHWNGEFDEQTGLDDYGKPIVVKKYYLTKLGVIDTGTWEADVIKSIYGGTGNKSYTENRLIYTKEIKDKTEGEIKDETEGEIQLLSSNHFIDDNKIIFYYNPDKDTIYQNKDELDKEFKFLVDGTVQFITSDDYNSIFKFTNGQLTIEQKYSSPPVDKILDTDITPTLVFYNKTDDKKGILKWGRIGGNHQIDILAFLSDSIDFALSTPKLEVNTLSHFNSEKDTRHNVLHFLDENENVRVVLNGQGSTFITSGSTSFTEDKVLSESEEEQKNLYLASNDKIYFYINNNDKDTKLLNPEHFIVLDQGKALYPDIDATGELGTDTNNWNTVNTLNIVSNTNLNITATTQDEVSDSGYIDLSAGDCRLINLNSDSYITNNKDLILTGDIVYHNLNQDFSNRHSVIRFLSGNDLRDGISLGGGGSIAIESGNLNFLESQLFLDSDSESLINGDLGQDSNIYIASEDKIYIYPSRGSDDDNQELSHYLIIDNKVIQPDLDNEWSLGSYSENWNSLYARSLMANDILTIKADRDIEIFTNTIPSVDDSGNPVDNSKKTLLDVDGNFKLINTERGYFLTDSTGSQYAGIYNNANNLWIGCQGNKTYHHRGNTFISAGVDASGNGYSTIYISVPDSDNEFGHINHKAFHEGMSLIPRATNTYSIGNSDRRWTSLYLNNFTIGKGTIKNVEGTNISCALIQSPSNTYIALGGPSTEHIFADGDNKIGLGHHKVRWKGLWTYGFTIDDNGHIKNDILPSTSSTYSLGRPLNTDKPDEPELRWKNAFFSGTVSSKGNESQFTIENNKWKLGLYLGSGGNNRGIYDFTNGSWIFNLDEDSILRVHKSLIPSKSSTAPNVDLGSDKTRWNNGYFKGTLYAPNITISDFTKTGRFYVGDAITGINVTKIKAKYGEGFAIYPFKSTDSDAAYVGSPGNSFDAVYIVDKVILDSDIRLKNVQPKEHLDKLLKVYDKIEPISYTWKRKAKIEDNPRIHVGVSSQQVEQVMLEENLTSIDFSALCYDYIEVEDPDTGEIKIDKKYAFKYGELHGLHLLKNQRQDQKIIELENKNKELEEKITLLQEQIAILMN